MNIKHNTQQTVFYKGKHVFKTMSIILMWMPMVIESGKWNEKKNKVK